MSPADTQRTAESVSAVLLHAINSPVMQQPPPSLPARDRGGRKQVAGVQWKKKTGGRRRRGGKGGVEQREKQRRTSCIFDELPLDFLKTLYTEPLSVSTVFGKSLAAFHLVTSSLAMFCLGLLEHSHETQTQTLEVEHCQLINLI